jgi:hypothetical protein
MAEASDIDLIQSALEEERLQQEEEEIEQRRRSLRLSVRGKSVAPAAPKSKDWGELFARVGGGESIASATGSQRAVLPSALLSTPLERSSNHFTPVNQVTSVTQPNVQTAPVTRSQSGVRYPTPSIVPSSSETTGTVSAVPSGSNDSDDGLQSEVRLLTPQTKKRKRHVPGTPHKSGVVAGSAFTHTCI